MRSWVAQFPHRRRKWIGPDAAIADLRDLLVGPQSTTAWAWHRLRRVAGWVFDHYVAVASLVTLIATSFYGLAYAWFYNWLDVTPEQAGLGPTQILTRSVLGGVTLTILISLAVFAGVIPVIPVRDDPAARHEKGTWKRLASNVLLAFSGAAVLFGLTLIPSGGNLLPAATLATVPLFFLLAASFRRRVNGSGFALEPRPLRFSGYKYLTLYIAAAIPAGLLMTGAVTLKQARLYGEQASNGAAVRDPKILGMPFLGVRAEPALISWTAGEPSGAGIPHCVFYLGGTGSDQVFYDFRSRSALHVPPSEVTVELRSRMSNCDAPVNVKAPFISRSSSHELVCHPGHWQSYFAPHFSFDWISEGVQISNKSSVQRRFRREQGWPLHRLYCRVSGSTALGRDIGVSRAVRIGFLRH